MGKDNLRDGRVKNWFYLENDLLDRQDLTIYEKMIYIVIARYVNKEDKAFPSVPTIAKKGSMSERQVQMIINSLVKKGLVKKDSRINKYNKLKTSNLYTLLSVKKNQFDKDNKEEVVHDMHHPGEHSAPLLVNEVHPNNTNIKKTSLDNVNKASSEEVVENSGGEIKDNTVETEEDINDIRRIIKESLKEKGKCNFTKPKDSEKDKNTDSKGKYFKNKVVEEYHGPNRYRLREKELLAKEIAEELEDDHSLGAFHVVVDKISEQRIRIFLSIVKDTHLTGKIKKSRGAMFISLAQAYAGKNNLNLNFK
jgi:DNA-binding transcriptional regulator YhcF (GntR family)